MKTQIQVEQSTADALKALGRKGDTYDDIINILLVIRKTAELKAK